MNTTAVDRIAALEMQVIRLRAERDTLKRENALLRSGIDARDGYVEGFADGAELQRPVIDLSEALGMAIV